MKSQTVILFTLILIAANSLKTPRQSHFFEQLRSYDLEPAKDKNDEIGGNILDMINKPIDEEEAKKQGYTPPDANPFEDYSLSDEDLKKMEQQKENMFTKEEENRLKTNLDDKQNTTSPIAGTYAKKVDDTKSIKEEQETKYITEDLPKYAPIGGSEFDKLMARIHYPFPETATTGTKVKGWAIVILIIFGTLYLLLRSLYNYIKNINKFISKATASLANQLMFLIISFILLTVIYIYGVFDSIKINWQYLIAGIALFIISWFVFGCLQIFFSIMIIKKWTTLEASAVSFSALRHKYDVNANLKYDKNGKGYSSSTEKELVSAFEFLVLKRFLFIPLFPVFKASSLRKEMKFSVYLAHCLLDKLRLFFKFSWSSWIGLIMAMMIWNVFIAPCSILFITIFMMLIPLLGIIFSSIMYSYTRSVYYKIVEHITQDNIFNYQDIEYNSNMLLQSMAYPKYLAKLIQSDDEKTKSSKNSFSIHQHMHQKPASLYEDLIIFGQSGFAFIMNMSQCASIVFSCWTVITFAYHMPSIVTAYSKLSLIYMIPALFIYFFIQCYLNVLVLKWFTIISSVEMKRNEKCIQKTINHHLKQASQVSEGIFLAFKRLYFDMKLNDKENENNNEIRDIDNDYVENEFELGYKHFREMIKDSVLQFTGTQNHKEPGVIDVNTELQPFLKSFGNNLSPEEIEFMLHLIDKFDQFEGKLTIDNLYDIYGAILYFRTQKPNKILKYVIDTYYKDNPQLFRDKEFNFQAIDLFINNYSNFFSKEQTHFIHEQCHYLGETFSLDSFIMTILSFRQYYPY